MKGERKGIVPLQIGDSEISLQFTWERIDSLGRNGVVELLQKAESGVPGDLDAMADLIVIATGGAAEKADLMAGSLPVNVAYVAVFEAWLLALHGPTKAPKTQPENPLNRLKTWSSTLFRRLWRRA